MNNIQYEEKEHLVDQFNSTHIRGGDLKDLEDYIKELKIKVNKYKVRWSGTKNQPGLNDRLEALNNQIEAKHRNYKIGVDRTINTEIKKLEQEYLELLELQEKELIQVNEIINKINELQEIRKNWLNYNKNRYSYLIKKRREIQKKLEFAKNELRDLKNKQYMVENSQLISDRIKELENNIIPSLEKQEKLFYTNLNLKTDLPQNFESEYRKESISEEIILPKSVNSFLDDKHELDSYPINKPCNFKTSATENLKLGKDIEKNLFDKETFTVKFNTNGTVESPNLYKPISVKKGEKIVPPTIPILLNSIGLNSAMDFDKWELNGIPFDFNASIDKDIVLNACYKKTPIYSVTYYDKNKIVESERIKEGDYLIANKRILDKKLKLFDGWTLEDGTLYDFSQPITGPVELYSSYKRDWNKIAAIAGGVGVGGLTLTTDSALGLPGVVSLTAATALSGATLATTYKLKNHESKLINIKNLKGIKEAGSKLINYFRDNKNINNLNIFFKTALASTLASGIGQYIDDKFIPSNLGSMIDNSIPEINSVLDKSNNDIEQNSIILETGKIISSLGGR